MPTRSNIGGWGGRRSACPRVVTYAAAGAHPDGERWMTSARRSCPQCGAGAERSAASSAWSPPPPAFRTDKQLTAPADRPIHAAAGTLAGSKGAAAGYDRIGPGSPPPNSPSQNRPPSSPVIHMRCSADHRPASRCNAAPDVDLEQQEVRMTLKEP